ncbi:hypothetical protein A2U01_0010237, partial [Trifolium medium]|nr:hypothetical protein [Trifolium medium]
MVTSPLWKSQVWTNGRASHSSGRRIIFAVLAGTLLSKCLGEGGDLFFPLKPSVVFRCVAGKSSLPRPHGGHQMFLVRESEPRSSVGDRSNGLFYEYQANWVL